MLKVIRMRTLIILFFALTLSLGSGLLSTDAAAEDIKTLRIGIGIDPDTIVPFELSTAIPSNIAELIYDGLFDYNTKGEIIPKMGTDFTVSPDGLTYTVRLRKGIKYFDGSPFNAQVLKAHLEALKNPKIRVPFRFLFDPIKSLTVVDDYTVKYHLAQPYPLFPWMLCNSMFPPSLKALTDYDAKRLNQDPAGNGPYRLAEWVRGERLVLVRNNTYYGKKPTVEKIIYQIVPETATRVAMLRAGQLDIAYSPTPIDIASLEASPNTAVARPLSTRMIFIGMNTQKGLTKDRRIRQAFNYAVDKQAITDKILFKTAQPLDAPLPPNLFGYSRMDKQYTYDPQKARALLKEANFPKDAVVRMITPTGRYMYDKQIAEAVQAYLNDIGVKTELRTYDWPTYMGMLKKPQAQSEVELYLFGWGWPYYDADPYLKGYFASSAHPPTGFNTTYYMNAEYDKLVNAARVEPDQGKRKALYRKAATILWEDAAAIWLHVEPYAIAYLSKYKGLDARPNERMYPTYITAK